MCGAGLGPASAQRLEMRANGRGPHGPRQERREIQHRPARPGSAASDAAALLIGQDSINQCPKSGAGLWPAHAQRVEMLASGRGPIGPRQERREILGRPARSGNAATAVATLPSRQDGIKQSRCRAPASGRQPHNGWKCTLMDVVPMDPVKSGEKYNIVRPGQVAPPLARRHS